MNIHKYFVSALSTCKIHNESRGKHLHLMFLITSVRNNMVIKLLLFYFDINTPVNMYTLVISAILVSWSISLAKSINQKCMSQVTISSKRLKLGTESCYSGIMCETFHKSTLQSFFSVCLSHRVPAAPFPAVYLIC